MKTGISCSGASCSGASFGGKKTTGFFLDKRLHVCCLLAYKEGMRNSFYVFVLGGLLSLSPGVYADGFDDLLESFETRVDAAEVERDLALHRLGQQYIGQLDGLFDQARQAANLEAARMLQDERQRFRDEGGMTGADARLPILRDLQERYLDAAFLIEREEARTVLQLTRQFDQMLQGLERQLTSDNRIEEAIAVRAHRQALTETADFKQVRRLAAAEARFPAPLRTEGSWHTLPVTFRSRAEAEAQIQEDGVILVSGTLSKDTYFLELQPTQGRVTAIRLEALSDAALPRGGPGRAGNGNFVLNRFLLEHVTADGRATPVPFSEAKASFSQDRWPVAHAIDANNGTGWAISPRHGRDHTAIFVLETTLRVNPGDRLQVRMVQQYHDGLHNLGKFRISATAETAPDLDFQ